MTRRRLMTTASTALLSLSLIWPMPTEAQTQDSSLQDIHAAIVQAIGVEPSTVQVSIKSSVFTVSRVNSNLSDHGARNGEASRIGPIVSFALGTHPEFKNIHTIRVQYVARSKPNGATKIVDTVDFRKAPDGGFVFHAT